MVVLKGCSFVGMSLYSLHVPSGIDGRAGFDVSTTYVFSQGVLAAVILVGGGAVDGGVGPSQMLGRASPLLSGCYPTIWCGGRSQVAGAEALRVGSELAKFPLSVCFLPLPALAPLLQRGAVVEQEGQVWVISDGQSMVLFCLFVFFNIFIGV